MEQAEPVSDACAGKHMTLSRMLSEGSLIFVRPIQPTAQLRVNPVPYKARFVGCSPEGNHRLRLNGVQPKHNREDYTVK